MIKCQYCGQSASLVHGEKIYPNRPDLFSLRFWECDPCKAFVGCHRSGVKVDGYISDGTKPLGNLANSELRKFRSLAHSALDPLWENGIFNNRSSAYKWLSGMLKIKPRCCHIGMFDIDTCRMVIEICSKVNK